jgi:hypothetical protein
MLERVPSRMRQTGDGQHRNRAATEFKAHLEEKTMLRKITLAFATVAIVGAAALAPTSASAKPFFWHPHHHFWGGPGIAVGFVDSGCYVTRLVMTPYGYRYRTVNVCY